MAASFSLSVGWRPQTACSVDASTTGLVLSVSNAGGVQPQSLPAAAATLQPTHSQVVSGSTFRVYRWGGCARHASTSCLTFGANALPHTGGGSHTPVEVLESATNGLLAELLLRRPPAVSTESLTYPRAAAHTVLVPIPTQWRRQVRRGFDHTWLLANAIQSRWV